MQNIHKLFDSYNRVARLYPALLSVAPLAWTIGVLHPEIVASDSIKLLISLLMLIGMLFLFASLARHRGKSIEKKLNAEWGGWCTTAYLRHRDDTLDKFTKHRYHEKLEKICGGAFSMPKASEELLNPQDADEKYRSATRLLLESRRDPKYRLLIDELASYGFRRNLLGLKPVAVAMSFIAILINALELFYVFPVNVELLPINIESISLFIYNVKEYWVLYTLILGNILYLTVFLFFITSQFVRSAADEYAIALLRTLD